MALDILDNRGDVPGLSYSIDFRPTGAFATLWLDPGHTVRAEAGAMLAMSSEIELNSELEGGLWGAVKRSTGGRSAAVVTYTAQRQRGRLLLAPAVPGDLVAIAVNGASHDIAGHSYLAASADVAADTKWGGAKSFFASDNALVVRVSGRGLVFVSAFGALVPLQLAPGEVLSVDTGHLVAWDSGMAYQIRKAAKSMWRSMTSGEGLVAEFTGPGSLLLQTRNLEALADALKPHLPTPQQH